MKICKQGQCMKKIEWNIYFLDWDSKSPLNLHFSEGYQWKKSSASNSTMGLQSQDISIYNIYRRNIVKYFEAKKKKMVECIPYRFGPNISP